MNKIINPTMISGKARSALIWAADAHEGQVRKSTPNSLNPGSDVPYIVHLVLVMNVIGQAGGSRNMICAGCLHDIVEDSGVAIEEVEEEFGKEVADLVLSVTKTDAIDQLPMAKKAEAVFSLCRGTAGVEGCAVKSADLLANVSDLVWELERNGIGSLADLYGRDRWEEKVEHYIRLSGLLAPEIQDTYPELSESLTARVNELQALLDSG